jgi:hypothetical protein
MTAISARDTPPWVMRVTHKIAFTAELQLAKAPVNPLKPRIIWGKLNIFCSLNTSFGHC